MEMTAAVDRPRVVFSSFGEDESTLPTLPPIVAHEATADGWRGLTARGEVFNIRSEGGGRGVAVPDDFIEMRDGQAIGRRAVTNERALDIGQYLDHFSRATELYRANRNDAALAEINAAIVLAPTLRARFNRALILLAAGRWREGLAQYEDRLEFGAPPFPMPPAGVPRWFGQDLRGKRLLLVHEQGFGDTLMMLRFVRALYAKGAAEVAFDIPLELEKIVRTSNGGLAARQIDYWCPMLSLLHVLGVTPDTVPNSGAYLNVNPLLVAAMRDAIGAARGRRRIGIAWSVGSIVDGDFPRAIPLPLLVGALDGNVELYSLQMQGADEAAAFGVQTPALADFADVAALASLMDEVVSIDTAALHVAGAIGHPNVTALLSHWCSWRWRGNPFYPAMKLCRQTVPGDWASALAQI